MRWPRGRYNGRRIVGIEVKVIIDVTQWLWVPWIGQQCGAFHWLFWRAWINPSYEWREP